MELWIIARAPPEDPLFTSKNNPLARTGARFPRPPNSAIARGFEAMAYVVTESCIKCKYTDCVDVCPMDCFREGPNMLTIDPNECIDCAVCIPECPVNAIYAEEDVPEDQKEWTALNAELAKAWPSITDAKPAPGDADEWKDVKDKKQYLER